MRRDLLTYLFRSWIFFRFTVHKYLFPVCAESMDAKGCALFRCVLHGAYCPFVFVFFLCGTYADPNRIFVLAFHKIKFGRDKLI
jgi:hypothetical protein